VRYLFTILILTGLLAGAKTEAADSGRFDWSLGQPTIVDDTVTTCSGTATVRYDWSLGQPLPVFDSTATCAAATPTGASTPNEEMILYQ